MGKSSFFLYAIYQRTQSESKSQLRTLPLPKYRLCMQSIKEHNLKANHNKTGNAFVCLFSVCNLSKNTIWKQITTILWSQIRSLICMQSIKEHNLKANHNVSGMMYLKIESVCNLSKNTIWKQITTFWVNNLSKYNLYAIYQRTQSESKSQLTMYRATRLKVCMQSIKEHNLKANHNGSMSIIWPSMSVCNLSKNTPARAGWNKSESKSQRDEDWN